jgi:serine phosphatase RsbU (regulator of sigma subunit)
VVKKFIHADGRSIWGDLAVSGIRGEDGQVETFVSQITDITAEVEGRQLLARRSGENMLLAQSLLRQTERLTADLRSAAAYVESTLPVGLDGPVQVSSYYLPSQELGGDCFDYRWVDDDHLVVYVIDVSGHGIEPALLSISVHNMLRSDALPLRTLLVPDRVLAELNRRFQMDQHGQHFFTMWFGVYQASTRTLRYASAGAPPAFAFTSGDGATPVPDLSTDCAPVGMFEDTVFTSSAYSVPPGCRILLYSDGAYELDLGDGQQLSLDDFRNLTARHASSPDSTLDGLVEELLALTPSHIFLDDCSLIELTVH